MTSYQLITGRKYDRLVRVHESGSRDIMCFIDRETSAVYEPKNFTQAGRIATRHDTPLFLNLAKLAVRVTS